MKKKILFFPFITFVFIVALFFYLLVIERDPYELPSALINKKVPTFKTSSLLNDNIFISDKEFGNNTILVNFFATWCGPCRDEHKYIKKLSKEKGFKILGINYKDNKDKTIKWLNELGNPYYNVILDNNGSIGIDWGVYGIPETFIVNSKARIKYRLVGPINNKNYDSFFLKITESENE
jgi:cytochrome c biogenesis protein CcmG/thiol:disulfide interchange protein DsbE